VSRSLALTLVALLLTGVMLGGCGITGCVVMPAGAHDAMGPMYTDSHDPYANGEFVEDPAREYR